MIMPEKEAEIIKTILKTKERVVYIYNRYNAAVDSDKELIKLYKEIFENVDATDTITRAGRSLRHVYPLRYVRSPDAKQISDDLEELNKRVWRQQ